MSATIAVSAAARRRSSNATFISDIGLVAIAAA